MIQKTENCIYCGVKMESKTAKKKFCCTLHRVYWNREKTKGSKGIVELVKENIIEPHKGVTLKDIAPILGVKKKTYSQLLEDAKNGVLNDDELKAAKLSPNQYELIKRKIKQQQKQ